MKTLAQLKCSQRSGERLENDYAGLSTEELRKRKQNIPMMYLLSEEYGWYP